jgi:hypothetical protein
VKRVAIVVVGIAGVAAMYAFTDDLLSGLPFTRSSSSWLVWLSGLVLFGVAALLVEGAVEWVFGTGDPWDNGRSFVVRVRVVIMVSILLAVLVMWNR